MFAATTLSKFIMQNIASTEPPTLHEEFRVDGMSCKGCVASVLVALKNVPGVYSVSVDLSSAVAEVEYDPTIEHSKDHMKTAIENLGYRFYPMQA